MEVLELLPHDGGVKRRLAVSVRMAVSMAGSLSALTFDLSVVVALLFLVER